MKCGVDEAGRGPAMGPLVVAAVAIADDSILRDLGVRDSKKLTPQRRDELAIRIRQLALVEVKVIPATVIDERGEGKLNQVEAEAFAELIQRIGPEEAFLDACDVNEDHFAKAVITRLTCKTRIVAEHRADDRYAVVSAASIIAKTVRDTEMTRICQEMGVDPFSGYCSDPNTMRFIEGYLKEHGTLPPHTRRSWRNIRKLCSDSKIAKLTDWEE